MKIKWTRIHFLGDVFRCCRLPRILRSLIKQQRRRRLQRHLFACKGEFALLRSLSRLFHLNLNSKGLYRNPGKENCCLVFTYSTKRGIRQFSSQSCNGGKEISPPAAKRSQRRGARRNGCFRRLKRNVQKKRDACCFANRPRPTFELFMRRTRL